MASIELSIYLAKENETIETAITDPGENADPDTEVSTHVATIEGCKAKLLTVTKKGAPKWLSFAADGFPNLNPMLQASCKGLLSIEVARRVFLIPFGQGGRFLFHQDAIERDFGFRVVANTSAPDELRAIDLTSHQTVRIRGRRQASKAGPIDAFGFDYDTDFVNSLGGVPENRSLCGMRVTHYAGSDSLHLPYSKQSSDLPAFLKPLVQEYSRDDFLAKYPGLGKVSRVKDSARIQSLEAELLKQLRAGQSEITFDPPDSLSKLLTFGYHLEGYESVDPQTALQTVARSLVANHTLAEQLRDRRVIRDDEGHQLSIGNLYSCVTLELCLPKERDALYVFQNGTWYRVQSDYVADLDREITMIGSTGQFVGATYHDEGDLNKKLGAKLSGIVLDKKNIAPGGHTAVEPCDVYVPGGRFVHVKLGTQSSTLSHLFAQGHVSLEMLIVDDGAWSRLRKLSRFVESKRPSPLTVDYLIVSQRKTDAVDKALDVKTLPFFSKINLRRHARGIKKAGCQARLDFLRLKQVPKP